MAGIGCIAILLPIKKQINKGIDKMKYRGTHEPQIKRVKHKCVNIDRKGCNS